MIHFKRIPTNLNAYWGSSRLVIAMSVILRSRKQIWISECVCMKRSFSSSSSEKVIPKNTIYDLHKTQHTYTPFLLFSLGPLVHLIYYHRKKVCILYRFSSCAYLRHRTKLHTHTHTPTHSLFNNLEFRIYSKEQAKPHIHTPNML